MEKDDGRDLIHALDERGELGVLGRVGLQWDLQCTGGLRRFWAWRARTSIDVLGLGVLVGRVAGFGVS